MNIKSITILSLALLVSNAALKAKEVYVIDPVHSGVSFNIRHFFNKVPGNFGAFEGEIHLNKEDMSKSKVVASIDISSVDTNNDDRDDHLRGDDFFDTANHPDMTFTSTKWKEVEENKYAVTGDLTIKGVTKEVVLDVELLGFGPGRGGKMLSGWEGSTTIDRRDFGISYGQGVVGNEVDITLNIQAGLES